MSLTLAYSPSSLLLLSSHSVYATISTSSMCYSGILLKFWTLGLAITFFKDCYSFVKFPDLSASSMIKVESSNKISKSFESLLLIL